MIEFSRCTIKFLTDVRCWKQVDTVISAAQNAQAVQIPIDHICKHCVYLHEPKGKLPV